MNLAVLLLTVAAQQPGCTQFACVPAEAWSTLRQVWPSLQSRRHVRAVASADFDGNGYQDYALLVRPDADRTWIAAAYDYGDHWRGGNVDVWTPAVDVRSIEVVPAGRYEGTLRGRAADREKSELESRLPGLQVVFGSKERRAYFLGAHAWEYVTLGERRGTGGPPNDELQRTSDGNAAGSPLNSVLGGPKRVLEVLVAADRPSDARPGVPLWVKVGLALVGTLGVGRLTFASGGGVSSLFAFALFGGWVVLPYALTTALWRPTPATDGHRFALTLGTAVICALGLLAYVPSPSASSTGALVFVFAPLWQLMCVGALWVVSNVWRRARASTQRGSR